MIRPKYALFAGIFAMTAYVLYHNERFLVQPENPIWAHYTKYGWWLLLHGVAGASALFLAPLQFSDRLRKRYTKVHRVVGRIYVVGALVLAPLGAYVRVHERGPRRTGCRAPSPSSPSPMPPCWASRRSWPSASRGAAGSPSIASG